MRANTSVRLLCDIAETLGISKKACLARTGLDEQNLAQDQFQLSKTQEIISIENFVRLAPQKTGYGVMLGKQMHLNVFGIWGFAILSSPSIRQAIATAVKYINLSFVLTNMTLSQDRENAKLSFALEALPESIRAFVLERQTIVTMTFLRELMQNHSYNQFALQTRQSNQKYAQELSVLAGIPVKPGANTNALVFPSRILDLPLPKFDPATFKFCLEQCENLLQTAHNQQLKWTEKVRQLITENIASEQKLAHIAQKLAVTERTLRRRLEHEGSCFRELYTDTRLTIAYRLLENTGLNVKAVAWQVGYSETASFIRAFSKKFTFSPGQLKHKAVTRH